MQDKINYISEYLPPGIKMILFNLTSSQKAMLKEIRIRQQKPLMLSFGKDIKFYHNPTKDDIINTVNKLSDYSLNSVKDSVRKGFITIPGGIRVGISGEIVMKNNEIAFIHNINGLNFRIPQEKMGIADNVIDYIYDGTALFNTLVISPPMMGKTTLLRDIARQLSQFMNVCIIDERNEIAACVNSVSSFDVGIRTDIIDSAPKPQAIAMAIRSLSPNVIVTDEIGSIEDCNALFDAAKSGVGFVASIHAQNKSDAMQRHGMLPLFENGIIKRIIILGKNNVIGSISDILKL